VRGDVATGQTNHELETRNKALIEAKFEAWASGTGSPYELLADDATWTITGKSLASKTHGSREAFLSEVIRPFNARMSVGPETDDPQHLLRGRHSHRLLRRKGNSARRPAFCKYLCLVSRNPGWQGDEGFGLLRQHRPFRDIRSGAQKRPAGPDAPAGAHPRR
jgi:hypothetical protein